MAKKPNQKDDKGKPSTSVNHRRSHLPDANADTGSVGFSRLDIEREMAQLGKILKSQDFESIDDVNSFLQEMMTETGGMIPDHEPETPLEKAQELVHQAWQADTPQKAIKLAKKALKLSPDCADAYLLLGDMEAESLSQVLPYYQKAVAAAERALGPEIFEDGKGHFWGIVETRPYMRARAQLADLLWELGQPDLAIDNYNALLVLNPGDNQGVRYILLNCLLQLYRNDEAQALLDQFHDDAFANWLYNRALLTFRQHGRSAQANSALEAAVDQNEYVPDLILGLDDMPLGEELPVMHGWGDENEAILYATRGMLLWAATPGAQQWLADWMDEEE